MPEVGTFSSIYAQGMARVATATPRVHVGDPKANLAEVLALARMAHEDSAALVVFPELCLTGYAIDDLLQQNALLEAAERAAGVLIDASANLMPLVMVGLPLRVSGRLYNVAAVIHRGRLLGVIPKVYLPNYREFYEKRHFTSGADISTDCAMIAGHEAPFGADLIFRAEDVPGLKISAEICEDLWCPPRLPPLRPWPGLW